MRRFLPIVVHALAAIPAAATAQSFHLRDLLTDFLREGIESVEGDEVMLRLISPLRPGLLLARVDGKSPVEYLTADSQKEFVRQIAARFLLSPPATLVEIADAWQKS